MRTLPAGTQTLARQQYTSRYNLQMQVLAEFAGG